MDGDVSFEIKPMGSEQQVRPSCAAEDYSAIRQRMEELRSEDAGGRHRVLVDRMYREMHHSLGMAMESLKLPKPSRVAESWVNNPPWHP